MTQRVIYQDLPDEFFQVGAMEIDNVMEYAAFESNCCTSYRVAKDPRASLLNSTAKIKARNGDEVRKSALAGDPSDCLELGLR